MPDLLPEALRPWLPWIFVASIVMFVGSLVALPIVVARLPNDAFDPARERRRRDRHPVLTILRVVARNVVGAVFVVAGLAMLVLPGQGLLTLVLGVALVDLPGKHALERRMTRTRTFRRSVNWMRRRMGREPFEFPQEQEPSR